jgi:hypothetical protein
LLNALFFPCFFSVVQAVCLTLRQFDGLKAGFVSRQAELFAAAAAAAAAGGDGAAAAAAASAAVGEMSDWDFLFMESSGELSWHRAEVACCAG